MKVTKSAMLVAAGVLGTLAYQKYGKNMTKAAGRTVDNAMSKVDDAMNKVANKMEGK